MRARPVAPAYPVTAIILGPQTQSRRDAPIVDSNLTMTEISPLDALEALHRELVAVCDHRFESLHVLEQELDSHAQAFRKLLDKPTRSEKSRAAVKTGKTYRRVTWSRCFAPQLRMLIT